MTDQPLAPCPFCGSTKLQHRPYDVPSCNSCYALGPAKRKKGDRVTSYADLWNRRAPSPAQADLDTLRKTVEASEKQFRHYADLHRAKGTPDGDEKAETNERFADMCAAALSPATRGGDHV